MLNTSERVVGSVEDELNHVSVHFDRNVGTLLRSVHPDAAVMFDYNNLHHTLSELGEFETQDNDRTPLEIIMPAWRMAGDVLGQAFFIANDAKEVTKRYVVLPMFCARPETTSSKDTADTYNFSFDPVQIHNTLRHELRHAVDFLDPSKVEAWCEYLKRDRRKFAYTYAGRAALGTDVISLALALGEHATANIVLEGGIASAGLGMLIKMYKMDTKPRTNAPLPYYGHYSAETYENDPLERRALATQQMPASQSELILKIDMPELYENEELALLT